MPRRFLATFEYTEFVEGEPRVFTHETIVEARSQNAAHAEALRHFENLARQSSVGWARVLNRCTIAPAPRDATDKGGRHVVKDPEIEP
jgi:hypothetical protein